MIKRNITPEAPRSAIPTTTFIIIFLPQLGLPVAIIIPPIITKTKETINIIVTNILVKLHINTGNASVQVTLVSPGQAGEVPSSIQLPIKGTEVLSEIPQQTPASEQDVQTLLTFLNQGLHSHDTPPKLTIALVSVPRLELTAGVQRVHAAAPVFCPPVFCDGAGSGSQIQHFNHHQQSSTVGQVCVPAGQKLAILFGFSS